MRIQSILNAIQQIESAQQLLRREKNNRESQARDIEAQKEELINKIKKDQGDRGVAYLNAALAAFTLNDATKLENVPLSELLPEYVQFYNPILYNQLLPLCRLAYLIENIGIPEEHAFKLAIIFQNYQTALRYLCNFTHFNDSHDLVHDACSFHLPLSPNNCQFKEWQRLASTLLTNPRFRDILPHALAIEQAGCTGKQRVKRHNLLDRVAITEKKKAIATIRKDHARLKETPPHRTRDERLNQLTQQGHNLRLELASLSQGLPLAEADMLILESFYARYQNSDVYKLLTKYGYQSKYIRQFYSLKRGNDDTIIPNLVIDGALLGYSGIHLKKQDTLSDQGAANAVCLGKKTKCCQVLNNSGASCVIHGISSPKGGFYVVSEDSNAFDEIIYGQAWVWREEDTLCLDSIESAFNEQDSSKDKPTIELFQLLAHQICRGNYGINQVNTGSASGITERVAMSEYPAATKHCRNYIGYTDAKIQRLLASRDMPYLYYDKASPSKFQEIVAQDTRHFFTELFKIKDDLKTLEPLKKAIYFALFYKNEGLLALLREVVPPHRSEALEILIVKNREYLIQLDQGIISLEAIREGAYSESLNAEGKSALFLATLNADQPTFEALLTLSKNLNHQDQNEDTVLLIALRKRYAEENKSEAMRLITKQIIMAGANPNITNKYEEHALIQAVKHQDLEIVKLLLNQGAPIEACDKKGKTALLWAAEKGDVDMVNYLLTQHANVSVVSKGEGKTVLHYVAQNPECLQTILAHISEPERLKAVKTKSESGDTALHYAAHNPQSLQIILTLFSEEEGFKAMKIKNGLGDTVLHYAAQNLECLQTILARIPEEERLEAMRIKNNIGKNALLCASVNYGCFKMMLQIFPEKERLEIVKNENLLNEAVFFQDDILKAILESLSEEERLEAIQAADEEGTPLLQLAVYNSNCMKVILDFYPTREKKFAAIKSAEYKKFTLLQTAAFGKFDSFKMILELYPEDQRLEALMVKNPFLNKSVLNYLLNEKIDFLCIALKLLNEKDRLEAIEEIESQDATKLSPLPLAVFNDFKAVLNEFKKKSSLSEGLATVGLFSAHESNDPLAVHPCNILYL